MEDAGRREEDAGRREEETKETEGEKMIDHFHWPTQDIDVRQTIHVAR